MRRLLKFLIGMAWRLGLSLAFVYAWARHPDAIPSPPPAFSTWLVDLAGAHDCESVADVEALYMLAVSFLVVSAIALTARVCLRRLRHSRAARP